MYPWVHNNVYGASKKLLRRQLLVPPDRVMWPVWINIDPSMIESTGLIDVVLVPFSPLTILS